MKTEIFKIGAKFRKVSGYTFEGEIRAIFTNRNGEVRIVGELVNEGGNGDTMLHIFTPSQISII